MVSSHRQSEDLAINRDSMIIRSVTHQKNDVPEEKISKQFTASRMSAASAVITPAIKELIVSDVD